MKMCSLEKRGNVYILTLAGDDEHRLNPTLIDSIRSALHRLRAEPASSCSALITTAQGKFFSNGFDLEWAESSLPRINLMVAKLQSLVLELMSLPMPTIAAVTGHASAGGMMLALSHDYVLMRRDRGFLYLSEMDIGLEIPNWFMVFLKCKITDAKVRQEAIMGAAKLKADMAVAKGIVHTAHDSAEETVDAAVKLGEKLVERNWKGDVYAKNRIELYRDAMEKLEEEVKRFNNHSKL